MKTQSPLLTALAEELTALTRGNDNGAGKGPSPISQPPPPMEEVTVEVQLNRLDRLTESVHEQISCLETEISPVLTPEGPRDCAINGGAHALNRQPAPLTEKLAMQAMRLEHALARFSDLRNRIQFAR